MTTENLFLAFASEQDIQPRDLSDLQTTKEVKRGLKKPCLPKKPDARSVASPSTPPNPISSKPQNSPSTTKKISSSPTTEKTPTKKTSICHESHSRGDGSSIMATQITSLEPIPSPHSPDSPPRAIKTRQEKPFLFQRLALPLKSELYPKELDFITSKDLQEELEELPLRVIKKMMLEPELIEKKYKEMLMYVSGTRFFPAHLPKFQKDHAMSLGVGSQEG